MYRILIADDEKIERAGIRFLLDQMGQEFEIFEAVNGKEALEWLEQNQADILITDVKMPFMNGIELLEPAGQVPYAVAAFAGLAALSGHEKSDLFRLRGI